MNPEQREAAPHSPGGTLSPADRDMTDPPGVALQRYLATLRARWRLVALVVVIAIAAGAAAGALTRRPYEATAQVLLDQQGPVNAFLGTETTPSDPERDLNTSVDLVRLEPVAAGARRRLQVATNPADLLAQVTVAPDSNSRIISISARSSDPVMAARTANAFADEYQTFRARTAHASMDAALASARQQVHELGPGGAQTPLGIRLSRQINQLQTVGAFQTGGVEVVRRAGVPTATAGHGAAFSGALGAVLGLLLAGIGVAVLARLDRRVRAPADVERVLGVPVLARIGRPRRAGNPVAADQRYSALAARLAFSPRQIDVLLITSPDPEAPTVDVALGLARALRQVGRRVILVENDLRVPSLADTVGVENRGLTDVLAGRAVLDDELVVLPREPGDDPHDGELSLLPAGPAATSAGALLAGEGMASVVRAARARADVVVLAGAPLRSPAAVLPLVQLARGSLLVVCRDRTKEAGLLEALDDLDGTLVGALLTDPPRRTGAVAARTRRWSGVRSGAPGDDGAGPEDVATGAPPAAYATSEVTRP